MSGRAGQAVPEPAGERFGPMLAAAAHAIIADARQALSNPDISDAVAVHDVRKAIKRWRALLRLLTGPLGDEADRIRIEARDLMRELTGARDAQSALDALADLRKVVTSAAPPLSDRSLENIHQRLTGVREAAEKSEFTQGTRDRLARYLDDAARALESWPLQAVKFATVADEMTMTYRRGRRLIPEDWSDADPDGLHDLRRRVVEHRHQLDLMMPRSPRMGQGRTGEAQRLRGRLGACQDLVMLGNFTGPHQPLAPWRSRLAPLIAARQAQHLVATERLAGRLFAEKPKVFRRRIAALWRARAAKKTKARPET